MPASGLARAWERGVFGLRPSCRWQGAVRCAARHNGVGEHDGLVIAVAVVRISKIIGGPRAFDLQGKCAKIRR